MRKLFFLLARTKQAQLNMNPDLNSFDILEGLVFPAELWRSKSRGKGQAIHLLPRFRGLSVQTLLILEGGSEEEGRIGFWWGRASRKGRGCIFGGLDSSFGVGPPARHRGVHLPRGDDIRRET